MTATIDLFGLPVTVFGIGCMGSGLAALLLTAIFAKGVCKASDTGFALFAPLSVLLSFLFSRMLYILGDWSLFVPPERMLRFWEGGFSAVGACVGFLLAAVIAEKAAGSATHALVNSASTAMLLAVALLRCFEGLYGIGRGHEIVLPAFAFLGETDPLTGVLVHPVYKYEAFFAAFLFVYFTWVTVKNRKHIAETDDLALTVITLFFAGQMVLEIMKNDRHMMVLFCISAQLVASFILFLVPLAVWFCRCIKGSNGIKKSQMVIIWLIEAICVGLFVFMAFRVDRGANKLLYYLVAALCTLAMSCVSLRLCRFSRQG